MINLMSWPELRSLVMDFWKTATSFGKLITVDLTPWEAKSLARSIMGIKCPPPTKGRKKISIGRGGESMIEILA